MNFALNRLFFFFPFHEQTQVHPRTKKKKISKSEDSVQPQGGSHAGHRGHHGLGRPPLENSPLVLNGIPAGPWRELFLLVVQSGDQQFHDGGVVLLYGDGQRG